jgi:hypothetical protein
VDAEIRRLKAKLARQERRAELLIKDSNTNESLWRSEVEKTNAIRRELEARCRIYILETELAKAHGTSALSKGNVNGEESRSQADSEQPILLRQ